MHFLRAGQRVLHIAHRPGQTGRRPLVFANSLGTDLRLWDAVVALLPPEIPLLRLDHAGHGLSDLGASSLADHTEDLAAVMDHFGLREALICGVSMGGQIAQALAAHRPDLAAGLVLSNTAARIGSPEMWASRIAALEAQGLAPMAEDVLARWFSARFRDRHPDTVAGYRNMLLRTPLSGYLAACAALRDADLTGSTARLRLPVICVAGREDLATPPEIVQALADLIPGAQYVELADTGHLPGIETPRQMADLLITQYGALA